MLNKTSKKVNKKTANKKLRRLLCGVFCVKLRFLCLLLALDELDGKQGANEKDDGDGQGDPDVLDEACDNVAHSRNTGNGESVGKLS